MENWVQVKGFSGYEVSDKGRVRSHKRKFKYRDNIVKPTLDRGYYHVRLVRDDGARKNIKIHRLVAINFIGESELHVNHKNGKKQDNNLENLEFVTDRENRNHREKNKTKLTGAYKSAYNNTWRAHCKHKGRFIPIGCGYATELEAHQAYLKKIAELGDSKYADRSKYHNPERTKSSKESKTKVWVLEKTKKVAFSIDHQTFTLDFKGENLSQAEWMAKQLRIALRRLKDSNQ